jgi:hypothetical protein
MPAPRNTLPFQYLLRGNSLEYLKGPEHASAVEQRDADLEDFLGRTNDAIAKLTARVTPGPWSTFFGAAGWTNYGSGWSPAQYRRVGDEVSMRGLVIYSPAAGSLSPVLLGSLPWGPPLNVMMSCLANVAGTYTVARIDISPTGQLTYLPVIAGSVGYMSLDAVRFSVTT